MFISFIGQVRKCCKTGEQLASLDNLSTKLECQPTSNNLDNNNNNNNKAGMSTDK